MKAAIFLGAPSAATLLSSDNPTDLQLSPNPWHISCVPLPAPVAAHSWEQSLGDSNIDVLMARDRTGPSAAPADTQMQLVFTEGSQPQLPQS